MATEIYFCEECKKRIEEGDVCLILREAETDRLVYVAHKDCAVNSTRLKDLANE